MGATKGLILLAVSSALTVAVVGCGDTQPKGTTHINHDLAGKNSLTGGQKAKTGTPGNTTTDPKVAAALENIMNAGSNLHAGTPIKSQDLQAGSYKLASLTSDYFYQDSKTTQALRAIHKTTVNNTTGGYTFDDSETPQTAGALASNAASTDTGRQVNFPTNFNISAANAGKWIPQNTELTDNMLGVNDQLTGGGQKSDPKNNLTNTAYTLQDHPVDANGSTIKASVMNILASVSAGADNVYTTQDEKSIPINLTMIKTDSGIRVIVSFEEQTADTSASVKATATVTQVRNIYLDYNFTAAPAK